VLDSFAKRRETTASGDGHRTRLLHLCMGQLITDDPAVLIFLLTSVNLHRAPERRCIALPLPIQLQHSKQLPCTETIGWRIRRAGMTLCLSGLCWNDFGAMTR
jgi:hypothetical protein